MKRVTMLQQMQRSPFYERKPMCPLCGKSLTYPPVSRPGPQYAICGGFGRHRWLMMKTTMRLLKGAT